jgi:DNA-binding MarR family transcriptional regulator
MRPFRWAFALAVSSTVLGWLLDSSAVLPTFPSMVPLERFLRIASVFFGSMGVGVPLFARVADEEVLAQANRQRIQQYVQTNPGASISEIVQGVGLGWGTVVHHLERLEKAKCLRSQMDGRRRAFVVSGQLSDLGAAYLTRTSTVRARLLAAVTFRPGSSQRDLAADAGISLPLANRHLGALERHGFVASRKTWRTRTYALSEAACGQTSSVENGRLDTMSGVSPCGTSTP